MTYFAKSPIKIVWLYVCVYLAAINVDKLGYFGFPCEATEPLAPTPSPSKAIQATAGTKEEAAPGTRLVFSGKLFLL